MSEVVPAKPIQWPKGKTAAASFSFDIDAESAILNFRTVSRFSHNFILGLCSLLKILVILLNQPLFVSRLMPTLLFPQQRPRIVIF